ncbi:glycosyltransferase family 39 protein [Clostridium sp. SHJSY1]|uniref:glycosyltransferase family 39 protein n=1 Tax=Clostridium sp. SHJSY1 TaxID=2942483 RepID=UPI002875C7CB|nr:glycosyltransferase family 39 protein [Clostridium sp. SHJSY1]MDS0528381.1 glycosyltransferase family 39 protein [Clostridium sp. SHJSY1]
MIQVIKKTIYLIFIFFIGLFIGSSFFIRAKYNYYIYGDKPILQSQRIGIFILLIVLMILLGIALYKISLKINKYSRKIVIPLTLLFSFAIQIVIIFAFTRLPTDDSQTVISLAFKMLYNSDYSSFQTRGYLHMFPFNFSIVLYLKTLLAIFPDNYLVIKIFNILFSLVTTLMIYLIYKEINYKSKENDYGVLIFAATYIPALFMCNLIYNDIISTAFFTSSIYCVIKFVKEKTFKYIISSAILLSIGNYFRSVGAIYLIAIFIYILLYIKKVEIKKALVALCIIAFTFNIPSWIQDVALKSTQIVDESVNKNSAPIHMWLNMGLNMKNFGFWDGYQSYNIYKGKGKYNKEKSTELFKEKIEKRFEEYTIIDFVEMYYKKIIWTWTEGTYQIERYGLGSNSKGAVSKDINSIDGVYSYTTPATDLFYAGSEYRSGLIFILYVMNFLMYCFIFVRLKNGIRTKRFDEVFLILIILGFIGFYILWEIKSRYIYPVYPLLIVLSYMGFKDTYDYILKENKLKYIPLLGRRL